jgi:hypothetical protein
MLPLISSHAQVYDREFRRRGVREQGWGRLYASGTSALRTADYAAEVTRLNAVKEH